MIYYHLRECVTTTTDILNGLANVQLVGLVENLLNGQWMIIAILVACAHEFHNLGQYSKAVLGTAGHGLVSGNGLREDHMVTASS